MEKKTLNKFKLRLEYIYIIIPVACVLTPFDASALQLHKSSEGIITHQMGHLFFLFSMVSLMVTIIGKGLAGQKGWRFIMYAALFFILWNLNALAAHFLDNQIHAIHTEIVSPGRIKISAANHSQLLVQIYYFLKLDHILCVPAMICLYKGLSCLVNEQMPVNRPMNKKEPR